MSRVLLIALPCLALVACPAATPEPKAPATAPSTSVSVVPSSSPKPVASAPDVPIIQPEGAAVKAPVFSDDDCNADSDCAPISTCHPDACVSAGKTGSLPPGTMCTMDCRGGTLDCNFNHCGCANAPSGKKKCAVLPGGASKH